MMKPIRFTPILKSAIWGGNVIPRIKHIDSDRDDIGESWEISDIEGSRTVVSGGPYDGMTLHDLIDAYGEELLGRSVMKRYGTRFPLLLKIIDAHHDLSVQVHPDNATAKRHGHESGKAEMWYILKTLPESKIYAGLSCKADSESMRRAISDNTVMDKIATYRSESGQVYYLSPGCIHAIGAGNLLVEIQQSSEITYRLYDYGRRDAQGKLRQLHIQEALESIDYDNERRALIDESEQGGSDGEKCLSSNEYFTARCVEVKGHYDLVNETGSFMMLIAIEGGVELVSDGESYGVEAGQSIFLPACITRCELRGNGKVLTFTA